MTRERERERRKKAKERRKGKRGGEREREQREKRRGKEKRETSPPVCRFSTPPCVGSKRLHVYRQNARMCSTRGRFAGTHGGLSNLHTVRIFPITYTTHFAHQHQHPHTTQNAQCTPTLAPTPATQHTTQQRSTRHSHDIHTTRHDTTYNAHTPHTTHTPTRKLRCAHHRQLSFPIKENICNFANFMRT